MMRLIKSYLSMKIKKEMKIMDMKHIRKLKQINLMQ